jgi:hypothetical protein
MDTGDSDLRGGRSPGMSRERVAEVIVDRSGRCGGSPEWASEWAESGYPTGGKIRRGDPRIGKDIFCPKSFDLFTFPGFHKCLKSCYLN